MATFRSLVILLCAAVPFLVLFLSDVVLSSPYPSSFLPVLPKSGVRQASASSGRNFSLTGDSVTYNGRQRRSPQAEQLDPAVLAELLGVSPTSARPSVNKNSLVPAKRVPSEYEKDKGCKCTPFYLCCDAGYCPEAIDVRNNLDFQEEHCMVDYEICCSTSAIQPTIAPPIVREPTEPAYKPPGEYSPPSITPSAPVYRPPTITPSVPVYRPPTTTTPRPSYYYEPPGTKTPAPYEPEPQRPPFQHRCGIRNYDGVNIRIINSVDTFRAQYAELPWMAAIVRVDSVGRIEPQDVYVCGGALVSPSIVVTAAHSVQDYANSFASLRVRLGEWDTSSTSEPYPQEDFEVEAVILHPAYKRKYVFNDLAVLKLKRPATLAPHIATICLPTLETSPYAYENIPDCVVSGWGKDSFYGTFQNNLKALEMPTVSAGECEAGLRRSRLGYTPQANSSSTVFLSPLSSEVLSWTKARSLVEQVHKEKPASPNRAPSSMTGLLRITGWEIQVKTNLPEAYRFTLDESFLCAGGKGRDSCKGDGGSPLVCPDPSAPGYPPSPDHGRRYVLTGLVSWGIGCAEEWPGVYVHVPKLARWIADRISDSDPGFNPWY